MPALALDGDLFTPDSPGYDAIRRPINPAFAHVRPNLVVRCRSVSDVVQTIRYATATGQRLVPRSGGHCFAGRSSTDGILLDLSGLADVTVAADGVATVGAGARLREVYASLHDHGLTLPAGCGPSVGIAGLTLGGGIGLLGRAYGLTCDRLIGAQVVLADATVLECDRDQEPDLFWALRGAGGGQFGVVTSLRFDTVAEPRTTRIEAHWPQVEFADVIAAWQDWAPDAPDELTVNLTLDSEPGAPVRA
ncbi:MAG: FAD-binding oxidoreductase, partial [Hamadaea sp.]|nr:FAD-binding oxidoreductase [Hamadaea sp.]